MRDGLGESMAAHEDTPRDVVSKKSEPDRKPQAR